MYRINIRLLHRCTQESGVIMSSFHLPNRGVVKSDGHRQRGLPVLCSVVHCGGRSLRLKVLLCLTSISWVPSCDGVGPQSSPRRPCQTSHLLNLLYLTAAPACSCIEAGAFHERHRKSLLWQTLKDFSHFRKWRQIWSPDQVPTKVQ